MGSILIDSGGTDKALEDIDKKAESLSSKLGNGIKTAAKWGAGLATAAAAGATALFGVAKNTADVTDRIDKMSQKIGISRTGFQELEYVLSQNGTDVEKLQVGLKTLTQRMGEATGGTGKGSDAFKRLGLSAEDSTGKLKSQEEMFEESAKALMALPEGAEKSQLAFDMFGKAGLELMPMLNGTAEGFDELKQNAHDMGLILSDDAVASGAQFTDTMDNIQRSLGAVMSKVGSEVMPMIQTALDWVLDHMPEIQAVVGAVFEKIGQYVQIASNIFTDYLMPVLDFVVSWIKDNFPVIKETIMGVIDQVVEIIQAFVVLFQAIWEQWGDTILLCVGALWDNVKNVLTLAFDFIKDLLNVFAKLFQGDWAGLWEAVQTLLTNLWTNMARLVKDSFNNILKLIENIGNKIKTSWDQMWNKIKSFLSEAWDNMIKNVKDKSTEIYENVKQMGKDMLEALKNLPADAWQMGKDFVQGLINGIGNMISSVKDKAKELADSALSTVKGVFGIASPSKVMTEYGEHTGQGLANGIGKKVSAVGASAKKLTDAVLTNQKKFNEKYKATMQELENIQTERYKKEKATLVKYMDDKKHYGKLTLDEEKYIYTTMRDLAKGNKAEIAEIDKKLYRVKNEMQDREVQKVKDTQAKILEIHRESLDKQKMMVEAQSNEEIAILQAQLDKMDEAENQQRYKETYDGHVGEIDKLKAEMYQAEGDRIFEIKERLAERELQFKKWLESEKLKEQREAIRNEMTEIREGADEKKRLADEAYNQTEKALLKNQDAMIKKIKSGQEVEVAQINANKEILKAMEKEQTEENKEELDIQHENFKQTNEANLDEIKQYTKDMYKANYSVGANIVNGIADGILNTSHRAFSAMQQLVDRLIAIAQATADTSAGGADGSHRDGLAFVPFDGYMAEVHKGERILTAEENKEYSEKKGSGDFNIYIEKVENSNGRSVTDFLREAEFYRKQKDLALGGA